MPMTSIEDEAFTEFLLSKAEEAEQAAKYRPNDLLTMLGSQGGYRTAVSLLSKPVISDGFIRLWKAGRLDLTIEALILESRWIPNFDAQILRLAQTRLDQAGYTKTSVIIDSNLAPDSGDVSQQLFPSPARQRQAPMFSVGGKYSRFDVFKLLKIFPVPSGGKWFTGYFEHDGDHFIFCNVGGAGRTGHDYNNHFVDDKLVWFGKGPSKVDDASVKKLLSPMGANYVFYRVADRDPFIFAGIAIPFQVFSVTPVKVVWAFLDKIADVGQESLLSNVVSEGAAQERIVKAYERNRGARLKCISRWGWRCFVCRFDFEETYGKLGEAFIHVHHLKPLSEIGGEYMLDPEKDLRPVCPNCHAMLHRVVPALTIEELQCQMLKVTNSSSSPSMD